MIKNYKKDGFVKTDYKPQPAAKRLSSRDYHMKVYDFVKSIFDFSAAVLGLIVTSPIWLITIVGILLSDFGNIFYTAKRIGKHNKEFPMYKFRSMRKGKANESVFRGEEDRIFPFGAFIRSTKIDELPQLLCCITGTMSIVGPRPAAKDQISITRSSKYALLSNVKPGLSGPAALFDYIYGDDINDEIEYKQKVLPTRMALEVYYVRNRSCLLDIKIIWYTLVCIFSRFIHRTPQTIFLWLKDAAKTVEQ